MSDKLSSTIDFVHTNGWYGSDGTHVRGDVFYKNEYLYGDDLVAHISQIETKSELVGFLKQAYGRFAIVHTTTEGLHIASDYIRRYPLYYSINNPVVISDSSNVVHNHSPNAKFSATAASEYL